MGHLLVALALAGCGDGLATSPDGAVDSVDEPRGLVSVEYRGDVDPDAIRVVFQHADSTLALVTRLDATGRANCSMTSGGFVSLVLPDNVVLTYAGVAEDDVLAFEHFTVPDAALTAMTVKVPLESGATSYRLYSACGSREIFGAQLQPLAISLGACDSATDILVSAVSATHERFAFRDEVPIATPVLFDQPYQPEISGIITVRDVRSSSVLGSQTLVRRGDSLLPWRQTAIATPGGVGTSILTMPRPASATQLTHVEAIDSDLHVIEWEPAKVETVIDWPNNSVRPYTERPTLHERAPLLVWSEAREGAVADGAYVELEWTDVALVRHTWAVLTPRTESTSIQLPTLPYPELVPVSFTTDITRFDNFKIDGGYPRVRAAFRLGRPLERGMWFTDNDRGRVVYQALD